MFLILYHEKLLIDNTFLNLSKVSFDESDTFSLLQWFYEKSLQDVFPNILIALRLYLAIPVANCSTKKSFSKLTKIKNKYRTGVTQENLTSLMVLYSESTYFAIDIFQ
jgi:hypothetical protein